MSTTKHTPGPWSLRFDYTVLALSPETGEAHPVAQPYGLAPDGRDLFANARLIAAAPRMLQLIRGFCEAADAFGDRTNCDDYLVDHYIEDMARLVKEHDAP